MGPGAAISGRSRPDCVTLAPMYLDWNPVTPTTESRIRPPTSDELDRVRRRRPVTEWEPAGDFDAGVNPLADRHCIRCGCPTDRRLNGRPLCVRHDLRKEVERLRKEAARLRLLLAELGISP